MPGAGRVDPKDFAFNKHHCVGCPGCPHPSQGPPLTGSPDVMINGVPALRQTPEDGGTHDKGTCCGTNKWICISTSPVDRKVMINGKLAFCFGDETQHCGMPKGKLKKGSTKVTVFVGDKKGG